MSELFVNLKFILGGLKLSYDILLDEESKEVKVSSLFSLCPLPTTQQTSPSPPLTTITPPHHQQKTKTTNNNNQREGP